jgi:hypothetical protein
MSDFTFPDISKLFAPAAPPAPTGAPGTDARGMLSQIIQGGLKKGAYDSSADFTKYMGLLDAASKTTSPEELQAQQMLEQSKGLRAQADFEDANPSAPPKLNSAPQYGQLNLPEVPTNVQPHPNAIASLGAGIAGLFAPRAAGGFGAAALSGAIAAAGRETQARQQKYRFDLEQSLLKHQDDARRVDAQARVDSQNNALTNAYTAVQHSENMKKGVERLNASVIEGEAGNLRKFVEGNAPAERAKAQAGALREHIKDAENQSQVEMQRITRAAEMLSRLDEQDIINQRLNTEKAAERVRKQEEDKQKAQTAANSLAQRKLFQQQTINERHQATAFAHEDRQARIAELEMAARARGERVGTMEHPSFEMTAIKEDMDASRQALTQANKELLNPGTNNPHPGTGIDDVMARREDVMAAKSQLKAAQADYNRAGRAARAARATSVMPVRAGGKLRDKDTGKTYKFNPATGAFQESK